MTFSSSLFVRLTQLTLLLAVMFRATSSFRTSSFLRTKTNALVRARSLSSSTGKTYPHKTLSQRTPGHRAHTHDYTDWTKSPMGLGAAKSDEHEDETCAEAEKMMPRPLKVQLFVDGTWLYYSLVLGRNGSRVCPMTMKLGENWQRSHSIDWPRLPQIVGQAVQKQLNHMYVLILS